MKISNITEAENPDFGRAIKEFIGRLSSKGYKLVRHTWEESSGNCYTGFFVARHPEQLSTYKLRDFKDPDAYHLGRHFEEEVDWGGYAVLPEYRQYLLEFSKMYPQFDELLYLDGMLYLPDAKNYEDFLKENDIPYKRIQIANNDKILELKIVEDIRIDHTDVIKVETMLDILDDTDLPIVAKRLYDILGGEAERWVEYRLDTKSNKQFNLKDIINIQPEDEDEADWWKK